MANLAKIQYYTVTSGHPEELDGLVNEKLSQGWELQGGVSVCVIKAPVDLESENENDYWYSYAQAMVRTLQ